MPPINNADEAEGICSSLTILKLSPTKSES